MKLNQNKRAIGKYALEGVGEFVIYNIPTIQQIGIEKEFKKIQEKENQNEIAFFFAKLVIDYTDCENTEEEIIGSLTLGELTEVATQILDQNNDMGFTPAQNSTQNSINSVGQDSANKK